MSSFLSLPLELHQALFSYLSPQQTIALSQTSNFVRYVYSPLAYSKCMLIPRDRNARFAHPPSDSEYLIIPVRVVMNPAKYSWFPQRHVRTIVCPDFCVPRLLEQHMDDYFQLYQTLSTFHVVASEKHLRDDYEHSLSFTPLSIEMCDDFAQLIRSIPQIHLEIFSKDFASILSVLKNPKVLKSLEFCRDSSSLSLAKIELLSTFTNIETFRIFPDQSWTESEYSALFSTLSKLNHIRSLVTVHPTESKSLHTITNLSTTLDCHKIVVYKSVGLRNLFEWIYQQNSVLARLLHALGADLQARVIPVTENESNYNTNDNANSYQHNNTNEEHSTPNRLSKCSSITHLHIESEPQFSGLKDLTFPSVQEITLRCMDNESCLVTLIPKIDVLKITSLSLSFNSFGSAVEAIHHLPKFQRLKRFSLEPWSPDVAIVMKSRITTSHAYTQLLFAARMMLHVTGDHFIDTIIHLDNVQPGLVENPEYVFVQGSEKPECVRFVELLHAVGYKNVADKSGMTSLESFELVRDIIGNPTTCLLRDSAIFDTQLSKVEAPSKEDVFTCMKVLVAMIETVFKNLFTIPTVEYLDFSKVEGVMNSPRLRVMVEAHPAVKQILLHHATSIMPYPAHTKVVKILQPKDLSQHENGEITTCYLIDAESKRKNYHYVNQAGSLLDFQDFSFRSFQHSSTNSKWIVNNGWKNTNLEFQGWI